jgi:hypothetical protein
VNGTWAALPAIHLIPAANYVATQPSDSGNYFHEKMTLKTEQVLCYSWQSRFSTYIF